MTITNHMTANGFVLPVAPDGSSEAMDLLGSVQRGLTGAPGGSVVGGLDVFPIRMAVRTQREAFAIRDLFRLDRNGHVWHLEDDDGSTEYSTKGLALAGTISTDFTLVTSGSGGSVTPKFGTHMLEVDASNSADVVSDVGTRWTVMGWHDGGSGWDHWVEDADGNTWKNGATTVDTMPWSVSDDSAWTLDVLGAWYDDLVFLPFDIPTNWPTEFDLTRAFSDLPEIRLAGDFTVFDYVEVVAQDVSVEHRGGDDGSGWSEYGEVTLRLVAKPGVDE